MEEELKIPVRVIDRPISFFVEAFGFYLARSSKFVLCWHCDKKFKVKEDSRLVWEMETHFVENHEGAEEEELQED